MNDNFFSPQEQKVCDDIIALNEQFQKILAIDRDSRMKDWIDGIHLLQNTILFIATKRNHPEISLI